MLKRSSFKRSLLASLLIGTLVPVIILKSAAIDSFISLDSLKTHFSLITGSIITTFLLLFLFFLKLHRCPKCGKNWVYECSEDDIIGRKFNDIRIKLFTIQLQYGSELHLEEYRCASCDYEKTIKVKRIFIKAVGN
ncbi:MAG: hypothetical protein MRQ07_03455 [Candidatus Midichloria sp.]|nr:hypothetical protein [Candidatus Midichloria sp.]